MKTIKMKEKEVGRPCISCNRVSKHLDEYGMCIFCTCGYGGKVKVIKISKEHQYDHSVGKKKFKQ